MTAAIKYEVTFDIQWKEYLIDVAIRLGTKLVGKQICLGALCMIDTKCSQRGGHFEEKNMETKTWLC